MSNFSVVGKLYSATQPEQKTDSFKVRVFVLEITETGANNQSYTNHIGFQLVNNNCDLINGMVPGQVVTVHFNLRGNLYQDRAITNLQVWKIEPAQQQQPQQQWQQPAQPMQQQWQQPAAPQQPPQQAWGQPAAPPPAPAPQQPAPQPWTQPAPQQQAWPAPNTTPINNDLPF